MLLKYAASSIENVLTQNKSNWNIEIESDLKCRMSTSVNANNYRKCSGAGEMNGCPTAEKVECSREIKVRVDNFPVTLTFKYAISTGTATPYDGYIWYNPLGCPLYLLFRALYRSRNITIDPAQCFKQV